MERILKTFCILTVVFFIAITMGSVADQEAYAGGGIDYKVTVSNPTDIKCKVRVWVHKFASSEALEEVTLSPGASHTWHCGAICPSYMSGEFWDASSNGWRYMEETDMFGNKSVSGAHMPACWSSSWKICRKHNEGSKILHDGDYAFCKN